MNLKHTLLTLCLLCLLIMAPAAAADVQLEKITLKDHPLGITTLSEIKSHVAEILSRADLRPHEKLEQQTVIFGMDDRLSAWLTAERDSETGEIKYDSGLYIPVITPALEFLGLTKSAPKNPYTEEEGKKMWEQYHAVYLTEYRPTGDFGGPIA